MKELIIKNIIDKADALAAEYDKTKDPLIREEWFQLVRSLDNSEFCDNEILDTILKPPLPARRKVHHRIK